MKFLLIITVVVGGISIIAGRQYSYDMNGLLPKDCELNDRRPNLLDRNTFYWCLVDGPVLMKCSPGMTYNTNAGKCTKHIDPPASTLAISSPEPEPTPKVSETAPTLTEGRRRCPQQRLPPRGIRCPAIDPMKYSVYFPDPQDCNCFYQCDNGVPKRIPCREDLHFNATTNLCDWPEEAGCYLRNKLRL